MDTEVYGYEELLRRYASERGPDSAPVVRLGFGSLDAEMRGISSGQVCGIAARTAVGKTWALASVEHFLAGWEGCGILCCSLEMPGAEWAERALAIHTDVAPEQVEVWAKERTLRKEAASFLKRMENVALVDSAVHVDELPQLKAKAEERISPTQVRVVLIDYLGMLHAPGRDQYERASYLGKQLKGFAKSAGVSVIVAMQLSRAAGDGSLPVTLDMLRDSGVLEESMDFVIGCWRPGRDERLPIEEQLSLEDTMRCRLLKNRKGRDGREVDLVFRQRSRKLVEEAWPFE